MALTLLELRTELYNNLRLQSDTEVGVFGTTAFRTEMLNRGMKDFVRRTRCLKTSGTFLSIAEQQEYDMATLFTDFLQFDSQGGLLFNGRRLKWTSLSEMDLVSGDDWRARTSTEWPKKYYVRARRYCGLLDKPDTSDITCTAFYLVRPDDMAADDDLPFNEDPTLEEYYEAPLLYATWKLLLRSREIQEAMTYRGEYMKMVQDCMADLNSEEEKHFYLRPMIYRQR
jgi:hypothetical protein